MLICEGGELKGVITIRTIIAGSRECTDKRQLIAAIAGCGWEPTTIISGAARGADKLGELWAKERGIKCEIFPADWDCHGKAAGYRRNVQMADNAEALIAVWDGKSKGTKHMIDIANKKCLRVYVHIVSKT